MILFEQASLIANDAMQMPLGPAPSPYYAGTIGVPDVGTNTVASTLHSSLLSLSLAAQTFEYAVENYDSLLRRLAE